VLSIGSVVIRVHDLQRQIDFWSRALGYQLREGDPGPDFAILKPPDGAGVNVSLDLAPSTAPAPPRIHLDLYTERQEEEVERLVALGATRVHWGRQPEDADFVILADPEGNRFCVVDITR
jgi:catechol 2,3-dioxygenase-like lactoylglutathione lyase family enzyme